MRIAVFVLLLTPMLADAQETKLWWPQFLGPQRNGQSTEKNLNFDWKNSPPKMLWKVPLGDGCSSLCIVGERIYTMAKRGKMDCAFCLDVATGKELWAVELAPTYVDKQKQNAGPRATPTYHEGKLYCLMPMGELFCLSASDGKRVWSADQFTDTGAPNPAGGVFYWGASVSPLVEGDLVIVQPGGNKNNCVAAYHKNNGKLLWTVGDDPPGYGSPIAATIAGQRQVVVLTAASVLGVAPDTGKLLWRFAFGNKFQATCASPILIDERIFVSGAYGVGSAFLEISGSGDKWVATDTWSSKNTKNLQTLFANAMIVDGCIYGMNGDLSAFTFRCLDLKTGDIKWQERVNDRQTPLAVDGHLLCAGERGTLYCLEITPTAMVRKGELPDLLKYKAWAAPALADGRLYLRDNHHVLCIDLRKP